MDQDFDKLIEKMNEYQYNYVSPAKKVGWIMMLVVCTVVVVMVVNLWR